MIGYLRGEGLISSEFNVTATILVNDGVGYEVHLTSFDNLRARAKEGFWIHEHAPQDAPHELYGFEHYKQRDLFRRLLTIKGVGPKVAMRIVGSGATGIVDRHARMQEFCKIRGVGSTLAQRIAEEMT